MANFSLSLSNQKTNSKRVEVISFLEFIFAIISFVMPFSFQRKSFPYLNKSFSYLNKSYSYLRKSFPYLRKSFINLRKLFPYLNKSNINLNKPINYLNISFCYLKKLFLYLNKGLFLETKSGVVSYFKANVLRKLITLRTSQLRGYLIRIFVVGMTIAGVGGIVLTIK